MQKLEPNTAGLKPTKNDRVDRINTHPIYAFHSFRVIKRGINRGGKEGPGPAPEINIPPRSDDR